MPIDSNIFLQYAALENDRNKQLQANLASGLDNAYKMKSLKVEQEKAKLAGLDLDKLATPALIKMQMGEQLTPQDQAVLKAWDLTETRKLAPDATGNYRKVNASIFGDAPAPQGFDLGAVAPVAPVTSAPLPDTFAGGVAIPAVSDQDFNEFPVEPPPPIGAPLNQSLLLPPDGMGAPQDALPALPKQAGGFDTGLVAPPETRTPITVPPELAGNPNAAQRYLESAAAAQATIPLEVAKTGAVEQEKNRITLEQENAKKAIGKEKFDNAIQLYLDRLDELQKRGGINKAGTGISGIKNYAAGTSIGQEAGRASSDPDQAIRDELGSLRNGIKSAVKEATGMSSQEMNSNVELQTFLDSISNPRSTYEANYNMASNLSKLYGSGKVGRKEYGDKEKAPKIEGKRVRQKSTGRTGQIINGEFVPD